MGVEWILGFTVSYTALLIALYKINQASINRSIENSIKILNIEKEVKAMKREHERDFDKLSEFIKSVQKGNNELISGMKKDNSESHEKLYTQNVVVAKSIASIEGYLKAQQEKK